MSKKTFRNIGIIVFVFSLILIFINDIVDNEFLRILWDYRKSFAMLGGMIIAYSFLEKKESIEDENKKKDSNFYLKYIIGISLGIIAYHLINYFYTICFK
ncbi:MAG: hypothetical protein Q4G16_06070 [Cruoricaptor ignavus]|nr:hypothetical protein [Cruoricaptor ignavus]